MARNVALSDIIIEMHVPDFNIVKDFYGKLGFKKVWEYPPKERSGYLVMRRQQSILAFFCGNKEVYNHSFFKRFPKTTRRGYGMEICIYISDQDIKTYYTDLKKRLQKKHIVSQLDMRPWGSRDFRMVDPFGYYLCIREPKNILHK